MRWLREEAGYQIVKLLPDGKRWAALTRLMFHWSMQIGRVGDHTGYDDRYCYDDDLGHALLAFLDYDGTTEPKGWQRHPASGRRRWGANPELEYVDF